MSSESFVDFEVVLGAVWLTEIAHDASRAGCLSDSHQVRHERSMASKQLGQGARERPVLPVEPRSEVGDEQGRPQARLTNQGGTPPKLKGSHGFVPGDHPAFRDKPARQLCDAEIVGDLTGDH